MQVGQILITASNAILPIVLLILFGYWLRQIHFLSEDFAKTANKFVFNVCLSCSMFVNVYNIGSFSSIQWGFVAYIVAVILILFLIGWVLAILCTNVSCRKGVIMQGIFRSNYAILGLSLASALGGSEAESVAAVASAFAIPTFNILGVIALTVFSDPDDDKPHNLKSVLISILKNPMILGAFAGMACLLIRELQRSLIGNVVFSVKNDLSLIYTSVNNLKSITTPLALVVLGAQFKFSAVKGMFKEILAGTLGRILLAPIIGVGGAILLCSCTNWLSFGVNEYPALIGLFGAPTAISGAVMAGQMGGDEQLATQIVVWSSIGSILTVFLQTCILMSMGLLPM